MALAAVASWGCGSPSHEASVDKPPPVQPAAAKVEFAKDSVIVRFRTAPTATAARSSVSKVKGTIEDKNKDGIYDGYSHIANGELAVIQLDKSISVDQALKQLRSDPAVLYAEPNYIVHTNTVTPNDPRFSELFGLNNTGQTGGTADSDIDAIEAWDSSVGSASIVVGVVDTGVDYNHEDLAANIWVNPLEIPGNGIDDDGNGFVDDVHGINAITGTGDPLDDNAHGTHCSGTIGAVGNNGIGVAGVNWEVSIMGLKFLDSGGSGTLDAAIRAIDYAVAQKNAGVNIRVLSNSWSGGGFSQALLDSILAANNAGILFVAAAANSASDNDALPVFPANYDSPNIISVAATDHNDGLASFSNFGLTTVDLGAPGVAILSTTPGNTYSVFSGTSMATPHVAGVAALVLSANSTLSVDELKDILINSGDPIPSLDGRTVSGKRLNAANALEQAGPPVPHFNLSVAPAAQTIGQGELANYGVDVAAVAGFTGDVQLFASADMTFNGSVTVSPDTLAAPGTATLTVVTSLATVPGTYNITLTAVSGPLVKTRLVSLRVRPFGTVDNQFPSTDTPIFIPDANPTGITSIIHVEQPIEIQEVQVDLNITHTFIGDLIVTLTSPQGTQVILHNHTGGGSHDIHRTYALPVEFTGQQAIGDWVLHVADTVGADSGTLDSWTLHIVGVPGQPTFGISASPASQSVTVGGTASYTVDVASFGFTGDVALSASASPPLADLGFSPGTVTAPGSSTLTVRTDCSTAPGDYVLTISGSANGETKSAQVTLHVQAVGSRVDVFTSTDTPISIPDANPAGIQSTINVAGTLVITEVTVDVNITHTFIGDLLVQLVGPDGTTVPLHNHQGGASDNIHQSYTVADFNGHASAGGWRLQVFDTAGADIGTLDDWTLHISSGSNNTPPTAAFSFVNTVGRTFVFTDGSSDAGCGSGVVAWAWSFGDGASSAAQNPTHVYALQGTYTVTLTVTDADGATATTSQTVEATRDRPRLAIMGVTRNPDTFEFSVSLRWSGANGNLVELYRNDVLADIPDNDGATVDLFRRYQTTYSWKICEQYSDFCSNEVSIVFGELGSNLVTVVSNEDGLRKIQHMVIEDVR